MDRFVDQAGLVEPLLDLLEDGVVVHDHERKIYLVNSATERITGLSRQEIIGMDCHDAFKPNGLCSADCAFKQEGCCLEGMRDVEVHFTRKDGGDRKIRVRSDSVMINGEKKGVLAVIRDVTELSDLRFRLDRRHSFHGMIGVSPALTDVFQTIRSVGASEYPVLITGESGTGKELAAGAIHKESRRSSGPFVPVNCGALPENILESELFGHVRGAFTGAIRDKKGRFELADTGTLFLDEVGELPLHVQVKLLRVLQSKTFERVGGEKTITSDVRILAATNRDLRSMVAEGTFREDLYYRLCVVPIELPPLRERSEDIPFLVSAIMDTVRRETAKDLLGVSDEAMRLLLSHRWPGNIRELINALQYGSVRCPSGEILPEHLPYEVRFGPSKQSLAFSTSRAGTHPPLPLAGGMGASLLAEGLPKKRTKLTEEMVDQALAQTGGNKVKAAKLLGVGRATLYRFLSSDQ